MLQMQEPPSRAARQTGGGRSHDRSGRDPTAEPFPIPGCPVVAGTGDTCGRELSPPRSRRWPPPRTIDRPGRPVNGRRAQEVRDSEPGPGDLPGTAIRRRDGTREGSPTSAHRLRIIEQARIRRLARGNFHAAQFSGGNWRNTPGSGRRRDSRPAGIPDYRLELLGFDGKLTKARRFPASKSLRESGTLEMYEAALVPLDEPPTGPSR